jgi:hypothetical protein
MNFGAPGPRASGLRCFVRAVPLLFACALALVAAGGCSDSNPTAPLASLLHPVPDIPLDELLAAPDSFLVDGIRLHVDAFVWRDFMPVKPSEAETGLQVVGILIAPDYDTFPAGMSPAYAWVIHDGEVWGVKLNGRADTYPANRYEAGAGPGPLWPVDDSVCVVLGIRDSTRVLHLARRSGETIHRTD